MWKSCAIRILRRVRGEQLRPDVGDKYKLQSNPVRYLTVHPVRMRKRLCKDKVVMTPNESGRSAWEAETRFIMHAFTVQTETPKRRRGMRRRGMMMDAVEGDDGMGWDVFKRIRPPYELPVALVIRQALSAGWVVCM